jgi:putative glycosyltransferase (TIGR04372 family)
MPVVSIEQIRTGLFRMRVRAIGLLTCRLVDLIRLFVPLRLLHFDTARIAHMMGIANFYLRTRQLDEAKHKWDLLVCRGTPSNETYFNKVRDRARIINSRWLSKMFEYAILTRPGHPGLEDLVGRLHDPELFSATRNPFELTAEEIAAGDAALSEMGVPADADIACFAVRDQAYLNAQRGYLNAQGESDWDYHRFRNGDLDAYVSAASHLCGKGYWCVRMGSIVERPLGPRDPKIIDYATHHRSDFMDVYLGWRCGMFLGDNSGIAHFAVAQGRGGVRANLGLGDMFSPWPQFLSVPMLFRDRKTGTLVPFLECIALGMHKVVRQDEIDAAGLVAVPTTNAELIEAAEEWLQRKNGHWAERAEDQDLVRRFYSIYPEDFTQTGTPRPPLDDIAQVAVSFLRRHADLLPKADPAVNGREDLRKVENDF